MRSFLASITLNNARQDDSYLHEHLAYELYRRAGLHAPQTAHGSMSFDGRDYGLYVCWSSPSTRLR